jgi:dihydroneopterin aldolase
MARDQIVIEKLELWSNLGVPEAERATPQRLTLTVILEPTRGIQELRDDVARTIDYAIVAKSLQEVARSRPRRLLETLAEELATHVMSRYPVLATEIHLQKYILPDAEAVTIRVRRERK